MPDAASFAVQPVRRASDDVIDSRLGPVLGIEPVTLHPSLPRALICYAAAIAGVGRRQASPGGAAWWSPALAERAALGEAVERYAAASAPIVRRASWAQLRDEGVAALDPRLANPHSPAQYAAPGFPFSPWTEDTVLSWTPAVRADGRVTLAPAALAAMTPPDDEPASHLPVNAGVAAARSAAESGDRALEELLERHCVATAWLGDVRWPERPAPRWLREALGGDAAAYDLRLHAVPNEFGLPVAAVLLQQRRGPAIGMGAALRPRWKDAVAKAAAEAVVSCQAAHQLDDRELMDAWLQSVDDAPIRPWRADRRYRDDYDRGWRDVIDVFCHVQLYLDPRLRADLEHRLSGGVTVPQWPEHADLPDRSAYRRVVRERGYEALTVNLTTPDAARCGWSVHRSLVPGLRATMPAAFPPLGGRWDVEPSCPVPLPHA